MTELSSNVMICLIINQNKFYKEENQDNEKKNFKYSSVFFHGTHDFAIFFTCGTGGGLCGRIKKQGLPPILHTGAGSPSQ